MNSKNNEGISVKEIEEFAKKNKFPVAIALGVFLAFLFTIFKEKATLPVIFLTIGALAGIFFPSKVAFFSKKLYGIISKQEKTIQIVIGAVFLVVAIFFPPAIFLLLGLHAGKDLRHTIMEETHPS